MQLSSAPEVPQSWGGVQHKLWVSLLWQLHTKTGVNPAQADKSTWGQASPDLQLLEQIWVAAYSSDTPNDLG